MTEREILKELVEAVVDEHWDLNTYMGLLTEARKLLAETDPPPEHPAVTAWNQYYERDSTDHNQKAETFLAGWTQALCHIAGNFEEGSEARRHLLKASDATPEHLL